MGIPQGTVIRAIQTVFEHKNSRGSFRKVNSLSYCRHAVEELWALEQRGLVGSRSQSDPSPELPKIKERLGLLTQRLAEVPCPAAGAVPESTFRAVITRAIEKIHSMDPESDFEKAEEGLAAIEKDVLKSLEKELPEALLAEIEGRVESLMGGTGSLRSSAAKKLRSALRHRELRQTLGLPALTLFDV